MNGSRLKKAFRPNPMLGPRLHSSTYLIDTCGLIPVRAFVRPHFLILRSLPAASDPSIDRLFWPADNIATDVPII